MNLRLKYIKIKRKIPKEKLICRFLFVPQSKTMCSDDAIISKSVLFDFNIIHVGPVHNSYISPSCIIQFHCY